MISEARRRAQQRSVEINGKDVLPLSMAWTFGQPPETLAVRNELLRLVAQRLGMLATNGENAKGGLGPAYSDEDFRAISARCNELRRHLMKITV